MRLSTQLFLVKLKLLTALHLVRDWLPDHVPRAAGTQDHQTGHLRSAQLSICLLFRSRVRLVPASRVQSAVATQLQVALYPCTISYLRLLCFEGGSPLDLLCLAYFTCHCQRPFDCILSLDSAVNWSVSSPFPRLRQPQAHVRVRVLLFLSGSTDRRVSILPQELTQHSF